jgi:hypothetical protein
MDFDGRVHWNNIARVLGEGAPSPQFLGLYQHEARKERLGTKNTVVSFLK